MNAPTLAIPPNMPPGCDARDVNHTTTREAAPPARLLLSSAHHEARWTDVAPREGSSETRIADTQPRTSVRHTLLQPSGARKGAAGAARARRAAARGQR